MPTIDIRAEADSALALIDSAKGIMRGWAKNDPSLKEKINDFKVRLNKVWLYVSNIQKQVDEHTPAVGAALARLRAVAQKLNNPFPKGFSITDVGNVVKELEQAQEALHRARPGDLHRAEGNKAKTTEGQVNGALAAKQTDRRLVVEAISNEADNGTQINAPLFGTPAEVTQMLMALKGMKQ
ncbi:hypothetical protein CFAM422_004971 [Trichoderma lentiforme]|uniref:Uncharacterized protein n=1 Tax=Trichoderma lentiforme TaxID=1567552 RepID=A0A9P4XHM5_9HYPO|nr:hypothetical protein CFAM422_004971 [Trichoderma lentiforme]